MQHNGRRRLLPAFGLLFALTMLLAACDDVEPIGGDEEPPAGVGSEAAAAGSEEPSESGEPSGDAEPPSQPNGDEEAPEGYELVWEDDFDGSALDTSKWNARNNTYVDYDQVCLTNRPENVFVDDGMLILRAQREKATCGSQTRPYTAAYLDTIGKASFTYGYFEVRAKSPNGENDSKGLWPAFWMRPDGGGNGEIDVVELPGGRQYYKAATQSIFHSYDPSVKQDNRHTFESGHPGDGFHTYATEWTPDELIWYIDGEEVWRRDRETTPWFDDFQRDYHLRLNFQVSGWLGEPDAATKFPADFVVDHVRVWRRPDLSRQP